MIFGHDGSWYQRGTDWSTVVSVPERQTLAIVKATEGTGYVAETLNGPDGWDRAFMADVGLAVRGFYHFSHPGRNSPAAEAAHFLATMGGFSAGEVPILDHEVEGVPAGWAAEWLRIVEGETGVKPWLYLSYAYAVAYPDELAEWPLWVAGYGANSGAIPNWGDGAEPDPQKFDVGPWGKSWPLWQYTSNGAVPGVPGRCDDSVSYHSAADLIALAGGVVTLPPQPSGGFLVDLNEDEQREVLAAARSVRGMVGPFAQEIKDAITNGGDGDYSTGLDRLSAALRSVETGRAGPFDSAETAGSGEQPDPTGRRTGEPDNGEAE